MTQKHCSRLWNGLMIRHNGLVFPCCNLPPTKENAIGDIYRDGFEEIINGEKVKAMRRDSLDGKLGCYENCTQVKNFEGFPIPKPKSDQTDAAIYADLQIEYGELCNVDCVMCWQDRTNQNVLAYDALRERLPLGSWKSITAYGGEVFLIKDAMKHIGDILDLGKNNLKIITNGRALANPALAERIVMNTHEVQISINAVTEATHNAVMRPRTPFFEQLLKTIKNLQDIKIRNGRHGFRLHANFCALVETLGEIPAMIRKFREFGFDSLSITFDHRFFPTYLVANSEVTKKLAQEIDQALRSLDPNDARCVTVADYGLLGPQTYASAGDTVGAQ